MSAGPVPAPSWARAPHGELAGVARNASTRYLALAVATARGAVTLPFNLAHRGQASDGLDSVPRAHLTIRD